MSPRRSRPRGGDGKNLRANSGSGGGGSYLQRSESFRGDDWQVRRVSGDAGKSYRCPGCDQEIPPGMGHVVAWPEFGHGVDDRRHWHTACWNARERRAANLQRGRGPKY
ncbi:ATP/GTP-binding protein [Streptacidiphilus monticola]|uniref:ATP/GTP-binding protein n=1 Tax=Streptacidiphilus monticola TaxID=2161674 RepID=A0ABW1G664_9ACTN